MRKRGGSAHSETSDARIVVSVHTCKTLTPKHFHKIGIDNCYRFITEYILQVLKYLVIRIRGSSAMASKTVFRAVFLAEPWRPLPRNTAPFSAPLFLTQNLAPPHLRCGCKLVNTPRYHTFPRKTQPLNCSNNEIPSSSPDDFEQNPPQEAVLKAISGLYS